MDGDFGGYEALLPMMANVEPIEGTSSTDIVSIAGSLAKVALEGAIESRQTQIAVEVAKTTGETAVVVSVWGARWLKHAWDYLVHGGDAGIFAKDILDKVDSISEDPADFLEVHEYTATHIVREANKKGKMVADGVEVKTDIINQTNVLKEMQSTKFKTCIKKGKRSSFSAAVSRMAYNKFGERKMTEANVLVTRRWLQKYFEEHQFVDLRTCDKNIAIDRALFLSFVPTKDFQRMKVAVATRQWEQRMKADSVFGGFWAKVFGLVPVSNLGDLTPN
jgi:hypothetical protein